VGRREYRTPKAVLWRAVRGARGRPADLQQLRARLGMVDGPDGGRLMIVDIDSALIIQGSVGGDCPRR
jgi:hypothetical protein